MGIDRFPKKPCKHCKGMGHFSYQCFTKPQKAIKKTPIKKVGKDTKQWFITRATWIRKNPPPIEGIYWECYLRIHPWCPVRMDIRTLTIDHVVSRTRDSTLRFKQSNLRPACKYCNEMKGSKSLEDISRTL